MEIIGDAPLELMMILHMVVVVIFSGMSLVLPMFYRVALYA